MNADVLRMKAEKIDKLNILEEWEGQNDSCELVELPRTYRDFIRIENE